MFDIEHIPGSNNIVADRFSRFCPFLTRDDTTEKQEKAKELETVDLRKTFFSSILDGYKLKQQTYDKISAVHNSIVGHFGVEKTYERCKESWGVWDHMREDIKFFIKHNCPCCQKINV